MRQKWMGLLAGLAALSSGSMARAEIVEGWEVGLTGDGSTCFAARTMPGDVVVGIHLVPATGEYRLAFASTKWDSLAPRANQRVPIELLFATASGDERIVDDDALIAAVDGGFEAVIGIWRGVEGQGFRRSLSRASTVTLTGLGNEIGTFPLVGAPAALSALDRCAATAKAPGTTQ